MTDPEAQVEGLRLYLGDSLRHVSKGKREAKRTMCHITHEAM